MKRAIALVLSLLLSIAVVSCGGGGDDGGGGGGGGGPGPGPVSAVSHAEETHPNVTFSGAWTSSDSRYGWSGGSARQSSAAGARATFSFTGTSVRWIGARGTTFGKARVSVDGGPAKDVDLFALPTIEARTTVVTLYDLSNGPHTLTIEVVSGTVVVDAFDVNPATTVSHWQDTDPNAKFSAGWVKSSTALPWSGNGAANPPDLPVTAQETTTTGATLTLPFRGTAISWIGYKGPDGGIATVQIDGGAPVEVDTYSPTVKYQEVLFTGADLADANHTLTITATGRRNAASTSPRIVVDAFDVMTPGRRYEDDDPAITYHGFWGPNVARVWTGGRSRTSNDQGQRLTFSFTGTSVSWIGCRKSSAGGSANVYIDGVLVKEVRLKESYPIEGYQMPVFRADGLAPGPHTLTIEVTSATDGPYVVVDAFDVHP
jgi:hypothetical protein